MVNVYLYLQVPRSVQGPWQLQWGVSKNWPLPVKVELEKASDDDAWLFLGSQEGPTTEEAVDKFRQQIVRLADFLGDESVGTGVINLVEKPLGLEKRVPATPQDKQLEADALADRVTFACNYATINNQPAFSPGVGKRLEEAIQRAKERLW